MNSQQVADLLNQCGPLLSAREMAPLWNVGPDQFRRLARSGAFKAFTVSPVVGPRRYSKALVLRYLAGENITESSSSRSFGRKRAV